MEVAEGGGAAYAAVTSQGVRRDPEERERCKPSWLTATRARGHLLVSQRGGLTESERCEQDRARRQEVA